MKRLFGSTVRKLSTSSSTSSNFNLRRLSLHSNASTLNALTIRVLRGGYNIDLEKVDSTFTKLHRAVYMNNEEKVAKYLASGKYGTVNTVDSFSRSLLHLAAINGNVRIIRRLLAAGAKVNRQDSDGRTPLIKAVECGHVEVLQLLMEAGANIDLPDREKGNTVLHTALIGGNLDCALYIIRNALIIDYNKRNHKKETFLHLAAKVVDLFPVIEELIANGIEIEATDELGRTAAQTAQLHKNEEGYRIITKYVTAKANPVVSQSGAPEDQLSASISSDSYENASNSSHHQMPPPALPGTSHPQLSRATSRTSSKLSGDSFGSSNGSATPGIHNFARFSGLFEETIAEENKISSTSSTSTTSTKSPKPSSTVKSPAMNRSESVYENCQRPPVEPSTVYQTPKSPSGSDRLSDEMSELDQMLASQLYNSTDPVPRRSSQTTTTVLSGTSAQLRHQSQASLNNQNRKADWLELLEDRDSPSESPPAVAAPSPQTAFGFGRSSSGSTPELSPLHRQSIREEEASRMSPVSPTSPTSSKSTASPLVSPTLSSHRQRLSISPISEDGREENVIEREGKPLSYAQVASSTPRKVSLAESSHSSSSSQGQSNGTTASSFVATSTFSPVRRQTSIKLNNANSNVRNTQSGQTQGFPQAQQAFQQLRPSPKHLSHNDFDRSHPARHSSGSTKLRNGVANGSGGGVFSSSNSPKLSYARIANAQTITNSFANSNSNSLRQQFSDKCIQVGPSSSEIAETTTKYETLLESVDRLLNSEKSRSPLTADPNWNAEMRILKRLSSLVYDANHNAIELDFKRKEVSLLKQTVESLQAQVEHEQSLKKSFEGKLRKMVAEQRLSNGHLQEGGGGGGGVNGSEELDGRLRQYDALLRQTFAENANLKHEVETLREELRGEGQQHSKGGTPVSDLNGTTLELGSLLSQLDSKLHSLNQLNAERARANAEESQLRVGFIETFRDEVASLKEIMQQMVPPAQHPLLDESAPVSPTSSTGSHHHHHHRRHSEALPKLSSHHNRSKGSKKDENSEANREKCHLSPRKSFSLHDLVNLDDLILDDLSTQLGARKSVDDTGHYHSTSKTTTTTGSNSLGSKRRSTEQGERPRSNFQADYSNSFSYKSKYFQSKINELRKQLGIIGTQ